MWRTSLARPLARGFSTTSITALRAPSRQLATPWFVDPADESPLPTPSASTSNSSSATTPSTTSSSFASSTPPPESAPAPLHALYSHITSLPIIHSVSVLSASTFHELRKSTDDLPTRRPHGKRRRGGSHMGGQESGVDDPPPTWDWVLQAEVKEGAEKRGAVNAVLRSSIGKLCTEFPGIQVPTKAALRNTQDEWGFLDLGDFTVHVLSKNAKQKWFSEEARTAPARSYSRWF